MIVLEGPDLAGKTTLAEALKAVAPSLQIRHLSRLPDTFDRYHDYMKLMRQGIIYDRYYVSDPAYAFARREDSCPTTPDHVALLDAHVRLLGGISVLLIPTVDQMRERWRDGEMYDKATTERAMQGYLKMLNRQPLFNGVPVYKPHFDIVKYGYFDTDEVVDEIHEMRGRRARFLLGLMA